jgi:hypothetical protein
VTTPTVVPAPFLPARPAWARLDCAGVVTSPISRDGAIILLRAREDVTLWAPTHTHSGRRLADYRCARCAGQIARALTAVPIDWRRSVYELIGDADVRLWLVRALHTMVTTLDCVDCGPFPAPPCYALDDRGRPYPLTPWEVSNHV